MEKLELDFKEYELKKNSMKTMYQSLQSQASSMLQFTLEWKELEGSLDSIRNATQRRLRELGERERQLDARELKIQAKVDEVFGLEMLIKEKQEEVNDRKKYLDSLLSSIELYRELERELGAKERGMEERIEELKGVERNVEEKLKRSREELNRIQREINEKKVDKVKEENLYHMEKCIREKLKLDIEEQNRAVELRKKEINAKEESLNRIERSAEEKMKLAIEVQKKALDLKQELIRKEQRLNEEEKLKEARKSVVEGSREELMREIQLKIKDHCSRKKSMEEWCSNLERKERELEVKEKDLDSLNKRTLTEFQLMEKQFNSRETSIEEREKNLEAEYQRLEVKERQLEALEMSQQERKNELEEKEIPLEVKSKTMENLHQDREKQLEEKKRQLEEQGKELQLTKKQLGCQMTVKSEPLEYILAANNAILTTTAATDHSKINIRVGLGLQLFMYEHMKRIDTVSKEITALLQQESVEPAKLVLDAMEGFHSSGSSVDHKELDLEIIRRACILLLKELKRVSVQINPQVRGEAMRLANDWKAKMKVGKETWLEVWGFLQLVSTYELTSAYDAKELQCLLDVVPPHEHPTELTRAPCTAYEAPANNITVASVTTKKASDAITENAKAPNLQSAATVPPKVIDDIQNFLEQKKLGKALNSILKHKLLDIFPPAQVLKEYVGKAMQCREHSEREKKLRQKDQVVKQGRELLQQAIRCIHRHKLESEYPSKSIEEKILELNDFMRDRRKRQKRPCNTVDSGFKQRQHKLQRTSLSADTPHGLLPHPANPCPSPYLNPNPDPSPYPNPNPNPGPYLNPNPDPCSSVYNHGYHPNPHPNPHHPNPHHPHPHPNPHHPNPHHPNPHPYHPNPNPHPHHPHPNPHPHGYHPSFFY